MTRHLDWYAIKDRIPVEAVARSLLGEPPGRGGARGLWWPCPFHEDRNPSFIADPEKGLYHCFGCGAGGDAIDLVMRREDLAFPEAVERLASKFGLDGGSGFLAPAASRPQAPPPKARAEPPAVDPSQALALRQWAMRTALEAVERLWSHEGRESLDYLRGRGLTDETIRAARLGCVASLDVPRKGGGTYRASGVSIPWFDADRLALLKIRQPEERKPKYVEAFRDRPDLFAPFGVRPGRPLIVCEGEFDALLLGQEVGDLANVATAGSASSGPTSEALNAVRRCPRLYAAHDGDAAGDKAASLWPSRAIRVRPPAPFKDWGELHKSDPPAIRRFWLPILRGEQAPAEPESIKDAKPEAVMPDWLAESIGEAKAERLAIMGADGIEGEPEPSPNPAAWLAKLNRHMGRPSPPELVELERRGLLDIKATEGEAIERIGPSLPPGGFEPDEADEAARLAMLAEGGPETVEPVDLVDSPALEIKPEAIEGEAFASFEGAVVELFNAHRIDVETEAGLVLPAPPRPEAKPWREAVAAWSIDRREAWGRLANRLIDDGQPWREAERLAFEGASKESARESKPKRRKPQPERPTALVAGTLF